MRGKVLYAILGGKAIGLGLILAAIWGLPSYFGHPRTPPTPPPRTPSA